MPTLEVTDEQAEYLEAIRTRLDDEVGPYGHVRTEDALQFLIDQHEQGSEGAVDPDGPEGTDPSLVAALEAELADERYQDLQHIAGKIDGVEPGGKAPELRERIAEQTATNIRANLGTGETEGGSVAGSGDGAEGGDDTEGEPGDEDAEPEGSQDDHPEESDGVEAGEGDGESSAGDGDDGGETVGDVGDTASGAPVQAPGGGGDSKLKRMMNLLEEHDDKWEEVGGDYRYEVTLPDGETEAVRTKDDVRAMLFKNYD